MAVVETSFLVALYHAPDPFHEAARKTSLTGDQFLVPCEVWAEFTQVMARRLAPDGAAEVVANALKGPFDIQHATEPVDLPTLVGRAAPIQALMRSEMRPPLSLVDLVVCLLAQRRGDGVLGFDEGINLALRSRMFPGARLH